RPPAKIRTAVEAAVSSANRNRSIAELPGSYELNVKGTSFDSLAPIVTVAVLVPSFSCQASIVYVPGGSPFSSNVPSAPVTAKNGCATTPTKEFIHLCTSQRN